MKAFSNVWFIVSIVVLPCVLNLGKLGCCVFVMANLVCSFLLFKKHNPEYFIH